MVVKPINELYREDVVPALMKDFNYSSVMQVPRLEKIVLNVGLGEALDNAKAIEFASNDIQQITGQRPVVTRAKKSIAAFKLREGRAIGIKVTLRGEKMWSFLARLIHVALPRTRDFQGISPESFDGRGNYSLGLTEQLLFPEVEYDKIDKIRGMELSIVTTAKTDDEGRSLLAYLGMPFRNTLG
ncbi:MAG TPA: 50S ribosomal protein L5 [candidate division Zixibacteria bacterium]|nr:50S ribosomal protein L5 [candidate division Zixibacteria bacterium]